MTSQASSRPKLGRMARRRGASITDLSRPPIADATLLADATFDDVATFYSEADETELEPLHAYSAGGDLFPERDREDNSATRVARGAHDQFTAPPRKLALLTASQEVMLAQQVEAGNFRARDELVLRNVRLVASVARRYVGRGLPIEDLMQEGLIGLLRAVDKFNYRRGYRFSTYATHWIRQSISRGLANQGRSIRLPAHVVDAIGKVVRVREQLFQRLGRPPTRSEVAQSAGLTEAKLALLMQSAIPTLSLESPVGMAGEAHLGDFIPADDSNGPGSQLHGDLVHDQIQAVLQQLTVCEREVIALRFGLNGEVPHTLEQVGRRLSLTRERVRQVEGKAMARLRYLGCLGQLSEAL